MKKRIGYSIIIVIIFAVIMPGRGFSGDKTGGGRDSSIEPNYHIIKSWYDKYNQTAEGSREEGNPMERWLWNARREVNPDGSFGYLPYSAYINRLSEIKKSDRVLAQSGWQPLGPDSVAPTFEPRSCHSIGRINCVAFHPTDKNIFWVGAPGGGVWKTDDYGKTWQPLSDDWYTLSVSDIAVDTKNPDNIYAATGDFDIQSLGGTNALGIARTSDGGDNWSFLLFSDNESPSGALRSLKINRDNSNSIVAAGVKGIWKTTDAGASWNKICDSLVTDLDDDPSNSEVLYAATGCYYSYYGGAGVIKSTDFGDTWESLNTGIIPKGDVGRVALTVSPADPNYIYVLTVNASQQRNNGLHSFYRSTDAGKTWTKRADYNTVPNFLGAYNGDESDKTGQGSYDLTLIADPVDKNKVYCGGVNLWMTSDGGAGWDIAGFWIYCFGESIHADHHNAAFNNLDNSFYFCNDGGIYRTKSIAPGSVQWITDWVDKHEENVKPGAPDFKFPTVWENLSDGLVITEFYKLGLSKNNSGYVTGGSQDNSCFYNDKKEWLNYIANFDGMETMIDHNNPEIIYGVWQFGGICKSSDGGKTLQKRLADTITSIEGERGGWITPVAMDPFNSNIIYAGFSNLWRSNDGCMTWEKIFNRRTEIELPINSPMAIVKTSYSNSNYLSLYYNEEWYQDTSGNWLLTPGYLFITKDGGKTWKHSTNNLPIDTFDIVSIEYDAQNPEIMWAAIESWDSNINLYYTSDGGDNWADVSKYLPGGIKINAIVRQPSLNNIIYAGTSNGVYYIDDNSQVWQRFSDNLPNAKITDLEIDNISGSLYAASYGRGVWKTDLLTGINNDEPITFNLDIFPNPSDGNFNVSFALENSENINKATISILDILGRRIYSRDYDFISGRLIANVETSFGSGVYFVKVSAAGKNYVGKLIIKKLFY